MAVLWFTGWLICVGYRESQGDLGFWEFLLLALMWPNFVGSEIYRVLNKK